MTARIRRSCLLAKIETVRQNVEGELGEDVVYSYDRLVRVLDTGLDTGGYFSRLPEGNFGALATNLDLFFG